MLSAEICGSDGGEVLESFAPTKFSLRVLAEGPPRPGANPCLDWSRDGTLYVAENAPDGTSGIVAWDVARGTARTVALNLPAPRLHFLAAGSGDLLLLGYSPTTDKPGQAGIVKKGFLQPAFPSGPAVFGALASERVFLGDWRSAVCLTTEGKRLWRLKGKSLNLGATGTVVTLDRKKLALYDPLTYDPRKTWSLPNKSGVPYAVRRRALVIEEQTLTAVFADHVIERRLSRGADPIASPSLRHVVQVAKDDAMPVIDVRTGETVTIALPPALTQMRTLGVSWSPSGRRLALAAGTGELYLLEGE